MGCVLGTPITTLGREFAVFEDHTGRVSVVRTFWDDSNGNTGLYTCVQASLGTLTTHRATGATKLHAVADTPECGERTTADLVGRATGDYHFSSSRHFTQRTGTEVTRGNRYIDCLDVALTGTLTGGFGTLQLKSVGPFQSCVTRAH